MYSAPLIIESKRDGHILSRDEITWLVDSYVKGELPDYQMAAWAMAVYFQGLDAEETAVLTERMLASGTTLQRRPGEPPRVDKHSTGGVGDKVSLILAPLLACCGLHVPMISGRGLGATGGTLDKLEAIPGFRTNLTTGEIRRLLDEVGCVMAAQTDDLVPADKKLYALRDVTGTVPSIPLITASIMSKKLAENLDALVLDVKWGSGALMRSLHRAEQLADALQDVARRIGLPTATIISDQNQPLGRKAGHVVEVEESLAALRGAGPPDLMELTLALGAELLLLVGAARDRTEAAGKLQTHIDSGAALAKFEQMVAAQGGDLARLPPPAPAYEITADCSGYVASIETREIGRAIARLGGGRRTTLDTIDHTVGIEMLVRLGDAVQAGQPLIRVFAHPPECQATRAILQRAIEISDTRPPPRPLLVRRA
jgi:pyrimidine-nucleoside phosphorylase